MKHLHEKNEQFTEPSLDILDVFPNPGVQGVRLHQKEFTSLCPLTQQPDYAGITIDYTPNKVCLESKSLKLYLASYRQVGAFAETICYRIWKDLWQVLQPQWLRVAVSFSSRGGIVIEAITETGGKDNGS